MNNPCLLIFISLAIMSCDHRVLSATGEESEADPSFKHDGGLPHRDGSRVPEEKIANPSTYCEGATSVAGSLEGVAVEYPYAFYGVTVEIQDGDYQQLSINIMLTRDAGACDRIGGGSFYDYDLAGWGIYLERIDIDAYEQSIMGWKVKDNVTDLVNNVYSVQGELTPRRALRVKEMINYECGIGFDSSPVEEGEELEGCASLEFFIPLDSENKGPVRGTARGAYRARYCPGLSNSRWCS